MEETKVKFMKQIFFEEEESTQKKIIIPDWLTNNAFD